MAGLLASLFHTKESIGVAKHDLGAHAGGVSSIAASGNLVVSAAAEEPNIRIWDVGNAKSLGSLQGHTKKIEALAISAEEKKIASASEDGDLRIWDVSTLKEVSRFQRPGPIHSLAFYPNGSSLVVGEDNGVISVLEMSTGKEERVLRLDPETVKKVLEKPPEKYTGIAISPKGTHLAAKGGGLFVVWDLLKEGSATLHMSPPHQFFSVCFSPDGNYLLAAGGSYKVSINLTAGATASVKISDFGGVLMMVNLSTDTKYSTTTRQMVFEDACFSAEATKVMALAAIPPALEGLKQSLHIHPVEALRSESLNEPEDKLDLGRGPIQMSSAFGPNGSFLAFEMEKRLYLWQLKV